MKKFLSIAVLGAALFVGSTVQSHAQANIPDYKGYLGTLDTLTNADTTTYITDITGKKANITFVISAIKISGTVAGTYALYASADGTDYLTAAVASGTITNTATRQVQSIALTTNSYSKYKLVIINANGSSSFSQRSYVLYRQSMNWVLMLALCSGGAISLFRQWRRSKQNSTPTVT